MSKIAIVTDNSSNLNKEDYKRHNIKMITLSINFSHKSYGFVDEEDYETFYKEMESEIPKTSAPAPGEIIEIFDEILEEGFEDIIVLPVSSGFSSFYSQLLLVSEMDQYKDKVHLIDSKTVSVPLGFLVLYACKLRDEGKSSEDIVNEINRIKNSASIYVVLDNLDHLKAGGRIGSFTATVGNVLSIKPIISINNGEGKVTSIDKVRGRKKSVKALASKLKKDLEGAKRYYIAIGYGQDPSYIDDLKEELHEEISKAEKFILTSLTPIITVHTGPRFAGCATIILD